MGDIRAVTAIDPYGHGTHVAGLIASEFVGVAPNARLIGLRVLNEKGQGDTANVVRAIEFAIANKGLLGIDVLNLSLGHPIYEPAASDPLVQAVEHATRAGIVVVVSAGNFGLNKKDGRSGYAGIASPGNAPSALTTGAARTFNTVTRADDRVAPYSSRGPSWYDGFAKPDFVAPGDNLLSIGCGRQQASRLHRSSAGNSGQLHATLGHQHGGWRRERRRGAGAARQPRPDPECGESRSRVHLDSSARRRRQSIRSARAGCRPD